MNIVYVLIFAVPVILNPFGYTPYEIPKVAFVALFVSLGILLILLLRKKLYINKFVFIAASLWLVSTVISTLLSSAPLESFWGSYNKMQGLLSTIYYILHFLICYQLVKDKKFKEYFIKIVIAVGVFVSVYAILQYFHLDPFPLGNIDTFSGRPYSTIGQPNMLGQWLIFPFFVSLFLIIQKNRRPAHVVSFLIITFALALTMNKATYIGIFVALVLLFWQSYGRKKLSRNVKIFGAIALLVFVVIFSGTLVRNGARSISSRVTLWEESAPIVGQNLMFGIGPEMYYQEIQQHLSRKIYDTENLYSTPGNVHFESYQILINQGLLGLLLYLLLLGFLAYIYFKKDFKDLYVRIAFYSIVASYISVQFSFSFSAQIVYLGFFLAVLVHEFFKANTINLKKVRLYFKASLAFILILFCGWSIIYGHKIVMADYYYGKSSGVYMDDKNEAWDYAQKTIETNPNSGYYYSSLIGLFSDKDEYTLRSYLEKYKKLSGENFEYYIAKAQVDNASGLTEESNESFEKALRLAPSFTLGWQKWGDVLFENGRSAEAAEKYEKVIELAPEYVWEQGEKTRIFKKSNILFYFMAKQLYGIYLDIGEFEKAEKIYSLMNK